MVVRHQAIEEKRLMSPHYHQINSAFIRPLFGLYSAFIRPLFGLYDVQGNVLEWTADRWHETLTDYKLKQHPNCNRRGLRGGSWLDEPNSLRFAFRRGYEKSIRTKNIGFRIVKDIDQSKVLLNAEVGLSNESLNSESQTYLLRLKPALNSNVQQLHTLGKQGCKLTDINQFQAKFDDCNISESKEN